MTIEERLENMEKEMGRQKRRYRWLLGAILLLAGGLIIPAVFETTAFRARAQATGLAKIIRANGFILEDEDGNNRAVLYMARNGPCLSFHDKNGNSRAMLVVDEDGPGLSMTDEKGKPRVILSAYLDAPSLSLYDENAKNGARLVVNKSGPKLTLYDENGKARSILSVDINRTRLNMIDASDQFESLIDVSKTGASLSLDDTKSGKSFKAMEVESGPFLALSDNIWLARAMLGLSKDGPILQLLDEKGKLRFAAGRAATETPDGKTIAYPESSLILFGPDGKVIWSAIK
jgi:hypothetical protein